MSNRKKQWLTLVFLLFFAQGMAGSVHANEYINMRIIKRIESGNNPRAWNKKEDGRGLYQINPICLKEYNNFHSVDYTPDDLWNPAINYEIANWYLNVRIPSMLRHFGKEVNTRNIIIAYNAGINAVVKGYVPTTTKQYLVKYEQGE